MTNIMCCVSYHGYLALLLCIFPTIICEINRKLYFNSYNCDESSRRVTTDKSYTLIWSGKTFPSLCTFNFTGGQSDESYLDYKLCYKTNQGTTLPSNVEIHITDQTETWIYSGRRAEIEKKCVDKVLKLGVSLLLGKSYVDSSQWSLELEITGQNTKEAESDKSILDSIWGVIQDIIPLFIVATIFICVCKNQNCRQGVLDFLRTFCDKVSSICGGNQSTTRTERYATRRNSGTEPPENTGDSRPDEVEVTMINSSRRSSISLSDNNLPPPYPGPTGGNTPAMPPPSYEDIFKNAPEKSDAS